MRHPISFLIPLLLLAITTTAAGASTAAIVLYDGSQTAGTPDTQGFFYLTYPLTNTQATQTFTSPVTILDTAPQMSDYAGYFANPTKYAPLDRAGGYQMLFTVQVLSETHASSDRAGFSLLVTSSDKRGIELGFWEKEVWAQEGGSLNPFTHAEGATFTTTSDLIAYRLTVMGDHYTLAANGSTVLSGLLRDYTQAPVPPLPINPYTTANPIFLGDDTSSAQARIKLRYAAVINAPPFSVYLPLMSKNYSGSDKLLNTFAQKGLENRAFSCARCKPNRPNLSNALRQLDRWSRHDRVPHSVSSIQISESGVGADQTSGFPLTTRGND